MCGPLPALTFVLIFMIVLRSLTVRIHSRTTTSFDIGFDLHVTFSLAALVVNLTVWIHAWTTTAFNSALNSHRFFPPFSTCLIVFRTWNKMRGAQLTDSSVRKRRASFSRGLTRMNRRSLLGFSD